MATATAEATAQALHATNDALNLSVLRRHTPCVASILSIAPYAVVYAFSPQTSSWEKTNVEGTLFVCSLHPSSPTSPHLSQTLYPDEDGYADEERYAVIVLNRRGLDNFTLDLTTSDDVDAEGEFVIVRGAAQGEGVEGEGQQNAWGIWIYCETGTSTEESREVNARVIVACAARAEESRRRMHARAAAGFAAPQPHGQSFSPQGLSTIGSPQYGQSMLGSPQYGQGQVPSEWQGGGEHGFGGGPGFSGGQQWMGAPQVLQQQQQQGPPANVLDDLFRRARGGNGSNSMI